jgi:hypothetical protein
VTSALLLVAAAFGGLDAEDWQTREASSRLLRSAGTRAESLLRPLASSESAEVRQRVAELIRPLNARQSDANAVRDWFAGGEPTDADLERLHNDPAARHRVAVAAYKRGLLSYREAAELDDGYVDTWRMFFDGDVPWHNTAAVIATARRAYADSIAPEPRELENR